MLSVKQLPPEIQAKIQVWKTEKMSDELMLHLLEKMGYKDVRITRDSFRVYTPKNKRDYENNKVSAVYVLVKDDKVIYVGQSIDLFSRLDSHHYGFGAQVYYIETLPEDLQKLEKKLIRKFSPIFNNGYDYTAIKIALSDICAAKSKGKLTDVLGEAKNLS